MTHPSTVRIRDRKLREHRAVLAARTLIDRMRELYREVEKLTDAPIAVHRTLACIAEEPGIAASKLADALGMQRPAMSQVLNHLTQREWIERVRSDLDQRSVQIFLTPQGRQVIKATSGRAVGALQRAITHLAERELDVFAAAAERIYEHLPEPTRSVMRPGSDTHR